MHNSKTSQCHSTVFALSTDGTKAPPPLLCAHVRNLDVCCTLPYTDVLEVAPFFLVLYKYIIIMLVGNKTTGLRTPKFMLFLFHPTPESRTNVESVKPKSRQDSVSEIFNPEIVLPP